MCMNIYLRTSKISSTHPKAIGFDFKDENKKKSCTCHTNFSKCLTPLNVWPFNYEIACFKQQHIVCVTPFDCSSNRNENKLSEHQSRSTIYLCTIKNEGLVSRKLIKIERNFPTIAFGLQPTTA